MLSILIPVYNCNVTKLVKELHDQCTKAELAFEILVFDDASKQKYKDKNRSIANLFRVNYVELSSNQGRSKIRNRLARTAIYDKLLFLDSDSSIPYRKFIKNYKGIVAKYDIICGGRIYNKKPPKAKSKHFHWKYGSQRECPNIKVRQKHPTRYFHSNNFIINRDLMIAQPFDEKVEGYGYEDILLGHQLHKEGAHIHHIVNPILHRDLDPIDKFLEKHEDGAKNLASIYRENKNFPVRLCAVYNRLKSFGIDNLMFKILSKNKEKMREKIRSGNASLRTFDLYRLQVFISSFKTKENLYS